MLWYEPMQPSVQSWLYPLPNRHLQHLSAPCWPVTPPVRECEVACILVVLGSLGHQGCWQSHEESQEGLLCLWGNGSLPMKFKPSLKQNHLGHKSCIVPILLFEARTDWFPTWRPRNWQKDSKVLQIRLQSSHQSCSQMVLSCSQYPITRELNLLSNISS